jgi:RimJ/RimL family protein N-acetyltransferase
LEWIDFVSCHAPALTAEEIKHGVILNILANRTGGRPGEVSQWSFTEPGQCAVKIIHRSTAKDATAHWAIVLGNPTQQQCRHLAEITLEDSYPGVIGPEHTAHWFANRASELGIYFREVEAQQIYAINEPPRFPKASGEPRLVVPGDIQLLAAWLAEFSKEAAPFDPVPSHLELKKLAEAGRYMFWINNDEPVSMAGIVRVLKHTCGITGVYTPPQHRGHGYAGAVTAAITERIQQLGFTATLYTDLRTPASNRCYSRIGFRPTYPSYHFHR